MNDRSAQYDTVRNLGRLPEALPALGPAAMRVYTALWMVLLVAALAASALGVHYGLEDHRDPSWKALGLTVRDGAPGLVITSVSKEARAGGLAPGDIVLAIDGRPVSSGTRAMAAASNWVRGPDGTTRTLTVRTGAAAPRAATLTRSTEALEQRYRDAGISAFAFHLLVLTFKLGGALLLIASAALLFRERRQSVAALFSVCLLTFAISWGGGLATFEAFGQKRLLQALWSFGWTGLLLAIMSMPDGRFVPRWTRWLALALILFLFLSLAGGLPTSLSLVLAVSFIVGAVTAMGIKYRRLPQGPERQQLRWSFFGFVIGAIFYAADTIMAMVASALAAGDPRWTVWDQLSAGLLISLALSSFALGLLVSLLRFRLYDADAVIGRSAGYALLTVMLAATFGVTAKLIEMFFATSFTEDAGALPGAIGAGLVLTMVAPLHRRIHDWAERSFQKNILALRRDLPPAVDDLRETATLDELLRETLERIMQGTRATRAAVAIDGEIIARGGDEGEAWPTKVPLRIAHQNVIVGTLLIGPRPDATSVGRDEREAVREIADPVARAIRIVRAREARDARQETRLSAIEALFATLEVEFSTRHHKADARHNV